MREPWRSILVAVLTAILTILGGGAVVRMAGCGVLPSLPTLPDEPPLPPPPDPVLAIGRLVIHGGYCSATVVGTAGPDGRRTLVSAWHCVKGGVGTKCTYYPRGESQLPIPCTVLAVDSAADISILATDVPARQLVGISVAGSTPAVGTVVWHAGYGVDRPGNVESGKVLSVPDGNGQVKYQLSVSPGDSGGGICVTSDGKLLSPVCCTDFRGNTWAGSPECISRLLAVAVSFPAGIEPIPMPPAPKQ